jgi:hypothetical protein
MTLDVCERFDRTPEYHPPAAYSDSRRISARTF